MAAPSTAVPLLLKNPGFLFAAPLLTAFPTNTVVGSKFTDDWAAAYVSVGATMNGHNFKYSSKVEPISVAEFFDPISYDTTERAGSWAFVAADWVLTKVKLALNGGVGAITPVSGTTTTTLSRYDPVVPGQDVRIMLGWESTDRTVRILMPQTINGSEINMAFDKPPANAGIACEFMFEVPTSGLPFSVFTAGAARSA